MNDKASCPLFNKKLPKILCKITKQKICGKDLFCCKDCEDKNKCLAVCILLKYLDDYGVAS